MLYRFFGPGRGLAIGLAIAITAFLVAHSSVSEAGTRKIGPSENYNDQQVSEYWLGAISRIMKLCGHYSLGSELRKLAVMSPYAREGMRAWSKGDGYAGSCSKMLEYAESFVERKISIRSYFESQYICINGNCTERSE